MFDELRIKVDNIRDWLARVLRARTQDNQREATERHAELSRQLTLLRNQQDRLLNLRLLEEIDESTFARKNTALGDQISALTLQIEACDRNHGEKTDVAVKAFELSQALSEKWLRADARAKRRLLEIVCLNYSLDDVTLVPEMRKPFDILAEDVVSSLSRGDRTAIELFRYGVRGSAGPLTKATKALATTCR